MAKPYWPELLSKTKTDVAYNLNRYGFAYVSKYGAVRLAEGGNPDNDLSQMWGYHFRLEHTGNTFAGAQIVKIVQTTQ